MATTERDRSPVGRVARCTAARGYGYRDRILPGTLESIRAGTACAEPGFHLRGQLAICG